MSRLMYQFVLMVLFVVGQAKAQGPVLVWDDFHPSAYPRMAQVAHITGPVIVEFTLEPNNVVTIKKSTGHPLLVPAAEETIKTSQLHCINCEDGVTTFAVIFDFAIANHDFAEANANPPFRAKLNGPTHVSLIAEPVWIIDPAAARQYRKVRSIHCFYLWRCKWVPEDPSMSPN